MIAATILWPLLPEMIPTHFGLAGEADRWARTSLLSWYLLPAIATGMVFLLWGAGRLVERTPGTWNLPEREAFLRLSEKQRAPAMDTLRCYLGGVSILTTLIFMVLQGGVFTTALGHTDGMPWYVGAQIAGSVALILIGAVVLRHRIGQQIAEAV